MNSSPARTHYLRIRRRKWSGVTTAITLGSFTGEIRDNRFEQPLIDRESARDEFMRQKQMYLNGVTRVDINGDWRDRPSRRAAPSFWLCSILGGHHWKRIETLPGSDIYDCGLCHAARRHFSDGTAWIG